MPFCLNGFAPPPATSARVLVDCVPDLAAASCATTTWCISATLGSWPNHSGSSPTVPSTAPPAVIRSTSRVTGSGLTRFLAEATGASAMLTTHPSQPRP